MKKMTFALLILCSLVASSAFCADSSPITPAYPIPLDAYPKCDGGLWATLCERARIAPMNLYATIIFVCAVIHTFCYRVFLKLADSVKTQHRFKLSESSLDIAKRILSLLGEVEIVFALWLIPLFGVFYIKYGGRGLSDYIDELAYTRDGYSEPVFVMVVMCLAATRPIIYVASKFVSVLAKIGGSTVRAWWIATLCVGPLLGSFITEPAAIAICATLLINNFFIYEPSRKFKYATLGLLFVTVSIGGALTPFAAPPIIMVARSWDWTTPYMLMHFGWKSVAAIMVSTIIYAFMFRHEFPKMEICKAEKSIKDIGEKAPPTWIILAHLVFLTIAVCIMHYLVLELFLLLSFIAFTDVTQRFQSPMSYRSPMLVAIFLGALVTHGSLQTWWLEPVLQSFDNTALFAGSVLLTSFNDNAAITYLASLVPNFSDEMKYYVVAGAISGGGLTVIANAPNLVGLSVLKEDFRQGVSPKMLLTWAMIPTLAACFFFIVF